MAFTNRGYEMNLEPERALQNQRSRAGAYWHSVTMEDHPNFILGEVLLSDGATVVEAATGLVPPISYRGWK